MIFICRGNLGKSKYYHANIKPFVDLSYGLAILGITSKILLHNDDKHLIDKIKEVTQNMVEIELYEDNNVENVLERNSHSFIIVDDDVKFLQRLHKMKIVSDRVVVYVQYLWGLNTNNPYLRKYNFKLMLGSFLPWKILSRKYVNILKNYKIIISNSQTCGYVLQQLYKIKISGVVYPPVGTDMLNEALQANTTNLEKRGIFISLGHYPDAYSRDLSKEISELKSGYCGPVRILVSDEYTREKFEGSGVDIFMNITVAELVKLYSQSELTYIPTTYELFGYMGAESLFCGTPVLLDTFHPFQEMLQNLHDYITISNPNDRLINVVNNMKPVNQNIKNLHEEVDSKYSAVTSAKMLLKILRL